MRRLALAAAGLALMPATALASRGPTHTERTAIRAAIKASPQTGGNCLRVGHIRVSTAGPWAHAMGVDCAGKLDPVETVLRKRHGKWRLNELGTGRVGCDIAPAKVIADLDLRC